MRCHCIVLKMYHATFWCSGEHVLCCKNVLSVLSCIFPEILDQICFSPCRQKKTTFLIQASMRYMWLSALVPFIDIVCLYFFLSYYTFQFRCWVVLVHFHSSYCPNLVVTGLRGPITGLKSHQKLSLLVPPPISNWRQTAQLKYTGSISWGRWEEMESTLMQMLDLACNVLFLLFCFVGGLLDKRGISVCTQCIWWLLALTLPDTLLNKSNTTSRTWHQDKKHRKTKNWETCKLNFVFVFTKQWDP